MDRVIILTIINSWVKMVLIQTFQHSSSCFAWTIYLGKYYFRAYCVYLVFTFLSYRYLSFFRTFQILFYALRPTFVRSQCLTRWHLLNILAQLVFDLALVATFGTRPLIYLIMSSFFAGSLHPCAGHFIAEHYLWDGMEQETYSYYGPLNVLAYNVSFI